VGYQTDEQKKAEDDFAREIGEAWRCDMRRLADYDRTDYYAVRGERVCAVLEVKVRERTRDAFPTAFVNLRKWDSLFAMSRAFGVPAFFALKFTDFSGYIGVDELAGRELVFKGREDRGGTNDKQPAIVVPVGDYRPIAVEVCRPASEDEDEVIEFPGPDAPE